MKQQYSFWIATWKTFKNSAILLVPFVIAMSVSVPIEYAWFTGPVVYFLKNAYDNRTIE